MKRHAWLALAMGVILAACGGGGDEDGGGTPTGSGAVTPAPSAVPGSGFVTDAPYTPRPPAPRSRALPEGDPYAFEAPFSVGTAVRQTLRGSPVSAQTGGQQATYLAGQDTLVLTVYFFEEVSQAMDTVRFALASDSLVQMVGQPYDGPTIVYGIAEDRRGGMLAAWNHEGWCFLVQTTGPLETLNPFLEAFPY